MSRFIGGVASGVALTLFVVVPVVPVGLGAQEHQHGASPYAGFGDREIKALSEQEVEGLLEGEGMEMALPAELHGYPGPRHVLDLRDQLRLSESQRERTQEIFDDMLARATELGAEVVALERELDDAFAARTITPERLRALLDEIGRRRATLREAHLEAHLALYPVLTEAQREHYDRLRGYAPHEPGGPETP